MLKYYFKVYRAMIVQKDCANKLLFATDSKEKKKINEEMRAAQQELRTYDNIYRSVVGEILKQKITIDDINEQWLEKVCNDTWTSI